MILFFLPLAGFVVYLLFGKPLAKKKQHQSTYFNPEFHEVAARQLQEIDNGSFAHQASVTEELQDAIRMHLTSEDAPLSHDNRLHIYTDGKLKFEALFGDIEAAQDHIHLEYYILKNDEIGKRLFELLTRKAKEGLKVLFLYDDVGSKSLPRHFFEDFIQAGGRATPSLPSKMPFINPRVNYRNHRKIVIIDGKTGYIGGFNVGDEYLGKKGEYGYWRDTHIRIDGSAVHSLQNRFLLDWNQASYKHPVKYAENYFPLITEREGTAMQVVSSGPDELLDQIKNGFLKMIAHARESVYIQTPYFIPDNAVLDAIRIAALGGADVRIMIPSKADHMFVHSATLSFANELLDSGVKVYRYQNGFLHAKTLTIDGKATTVGSANMDNRSFSLNFEANVFVYGEEAAEEMNRIFSRDMELSDELTQEAFEGRSLFERGKQRVAKMVAPIL